MYTFNFYLIFVLKRVHLLVQINWESLDLTNNLD